MSPELENKLASEFPFMRVEKRYKSGEFYGFGCECGDGWYQLLHDLCRDITNYFKDFGVSPEDIPLRPDQIKEKYGELCFYYSGDIPYEMDEGLYDIIYDYEKKSTETCERCGKPGKLRGGGWVMCLCDDCWTESQKGR